MISEGTVDQFTTSFPDILLTARQAYRIANLIAHRYGPEPRWTLIGSQSDISSEGYSYEWQVNFLLMQQQAIAYIILASRAIDRDVSRAEINVHATIEPRGYQGSDVWQYTLNQHSLLPEPHLLCDSPEAVRLLMAEGADFSDYHQDFYLDGYVQDNGQAMWRVEQDKEYLVPFERQEQT